MKAQDMAPVASPPILASALYQQSVFCAMLTTLANQQGYDLRGLGVFGTAPHDNVGGRCLGPQILLAHVTATHDLFHESACARKHATDIFARITGYNTQ